MSLFAQMDYRLMFFFYFISKKFAHKICRNDSYNMHIVSSMKFAHRRFTRLIQLFATHDREFTEKFI